MRHWTSYLTKHSWWTTVSKTRRCNSSDRSIKQFREMLWIQVPPCIWKRRMHYLSNGSFQMEVGTTTFKWSAETMVTSRWPYKPTKQRVVQLFSQILHIYKLSSRSIPSVDHPRMWSCLRKSDQLLVGTMRSNTKIGLTRPCQCFRVLLWKRLKGAVEGSLIMEENDHLAQA